MPMPWESRLALAMGGTALSAGWHACRDPDAVNITAETDGGHVRTHREPRLAETAAWSAPG